VLAYVVDDSIKTEKKFPPDQGEAGEVNLVPHKRAIDEEVLTSNGQAGASVKGIRSSKFAGK